MVPELELEDELLEDDELLDEEELLELLELLDDEELPAGGVPLPPHPASATANKTGPRVLNEKLVFFTARAPR